MREVALREKLVAEHRRAVEVAARRAKGLEARGDLEAASVWRRRAKAYRVLATIERDHARLLRRPAESQSHAMPPAATGKLTTEDIAILTSWSIEKETFER